MRQRETTRKTRKGRHQTIRSVTERTGSCRGSLVDRFILVRVERRSFWRDVFVFPWMVPATSGGSPSRPGSLKTSLSGSSVPRSHKVRPPCWDVSGSLEFYTSSESFVPLNTGPVKTSRSYCSPLRPSLPPSVTIVYSGITRKRRVASLLGGVRAHLLPPHSRLRRPTLRRVPGSGWDTG